MISCKYFFVAFLPIFVSMHVKPQKNRKSYSVCQFFFQASLPKFGTHRTELLQFAPIIVDQWMGQAQDRWRHSLHRECAIVDTLVLTPVVSCTYLVIYVSSVCAFCIYRGPWSVGFEFVQVDFPYITWYKRDYDRWIFSNIIS